jgi:hypothetical protein
MPLVEHSKRARGGKRVGGERLHRYMYTLVRRVAYTTFWKEAIGKLTYGAARARLGLKYSFSQKARESELNLTSEIQSSQ